MIKHCCCTLLCLLVVCFVAHRAGAVAPDPAFAAYLATVKNLDAEKPQDLYKAAVGFVTYLQSALKGDKKVVLEQALDESLRCNGAEMKKEEALKNGDAVFNSVIMRCLQGKPEDLFVIRDMKQVMACDGRLWFSLNDGLDGAKIYTVTNSPGAE